MNLLERISFLIERQLDLVEKLTQNKDGGKEAPSGGGGGTKAPSGVSIDIEAFVNAAKGFDAKTQKNAKSLVAFIGDISEKITSRISPEDAETMNKVLTTTGKGIKNLARDLALATPWLLLSKLATPLVGGLVDSMVKIVKQTQKLKSKDAEEGLKAIELGGSVILKTAAKMALAAPLLLIAIPSALLGAALIGIFVLTFAKVGEVLGKNKNVDKGIATLKSASMAMLLFAGSLALSTLLMIPVISNPLGVLTLFATLGISALVFDLIGKASKDVKKGAAAVAWMSLSLDLFAISLLISSTLVASVDPMSLLLLGGSLIGFALIFGIAGKFWADIGLGALAFAFIGLSLMLIANPLQTISEVYEKNSNILWQLPAQLIGLGLTFALAGPFLPLIALGAIAFGLVGGALYALGAGLTSILSIPDVSEEKIDLIGYSIKGLVKGFAKGFEDISMAEALTLPLKIPIIAGLGLALLPLSMGIRAWSKVAGDWDESDSDNLGYVIQSMSRAFATAGSTSGMSTLFGFNVGENDVERGIESTQEMGENLQNLAEGILAWKTMKLTPEDMATIEGNISKVLNTIPSIFAGIGQRDRQGLSKQKSIWGQLFGADLEKGDIEQGIESTLKMGENLKNLAEGVLAWKPGGKAAFTADDIKGVASNVAMVLGVIPDIFAKVGSADKKSEGIFPWSDGDIQRGVDLVGKFADPLKTLAATFKDLKDIQDPVNTGKKFGVGVAFVFAGVAKGLSCITEDAIDKLEKFVKPFDKLVKAVKEMNPAMKEFSSYFTMKKETVDGFLKWADALKIISEIKSADLESNTAYSEKLASNLTNTGTASSYSPVASPIIGAKNPTVTNPAATAAATKANPAAVAKQANDDAMKAMMDTFNGAIKALIDAMGSQKSELSAIKLRLDGTLKVKEMSL